MSDLLAGWGSVQAHVDFAEGRDDGHVRSVEHGQQKLHGQREQLRSAHGGKVTQLGLTAPTRERRAVLRRVER